ncbi:hydrolase [Bacillus dakarensis]|uniref:hydrolase n=1 Tax=Robertmurraya dakarensis TaxID=1926278 RepID=UPI000981ACA1|nr:hydrolase [Bacillus dakarensis]
MESRNFKLDTEWNMIHYPERPTGFGILIIGDERHYVDSNGSFWTHNEGKLAFIDALKQSGYTIFYSNLYGKNWGSEKAVELAKRLYEFIIRTEIINDKIHLIAEGMGSLVALRLIEEMQEKIRSTVLINPVLSLKDQLEQEKEHKFFYKKLLKELSYSYELEGDQLLEVINNQKQQWLDVIPIIPMKVIHVLSGQKAFNESKQLNDLSMKWENENAPVTLTYLVPEKKHQLEIDTIKFLKKNESVL